MLSMPEPNIQRLLPPEIMTRAARGIGHISHPIRLRILEFLDVNGMSSVSQISEHISTEQMITSQHLKKLRDANLVRTHRRGIFIYYEICKEYPASIFVCMRKLFGHMTDQLEFLRDDFREILPSDYTTMIANRIKLFAHIDKMRILEYLLYAGTSCVCDIANAINLSQPSTSQYLKKLYEDDFVKPTRNGRHVYYEITPGVHKTALACIHKRYNHVGDKF